MSTIHGAYPTGQRFALLKIAPDNFFMYRTYGAPKIQVRGTQYVVSRVFGDARYPQLFVMVYLHPTLFHKGTL